MREGWWPPVAKSKYKVIIFTYAVVTKNKLILFCQAYYIAESFLLLAKRHHEHCLFANMLCCNMSRTNFLKNMRGVWVWSRDFSLGINQFFTILNCKCVTVLIVLLSRCLWVWWTRIVATVYLIDDARYERKLEGHTVATIILALKWIRTSSTSYLFSYRNFFCKISNWNAAKTKLETRSGKWNEINQLVVTTKALFTRR